MTNQTLVASVLTDADDDLFAAPPTAASSDRLPLSANTEVLSVSGCSIGFIRGCSVPANASGRLSPTRTPIQARLPHLLSSAFVRLRFCAVDRWRTAWAWPMKRPATPRDDRPTGFIPRSNRTLERGRLRRTTSLRPRLTLAVRDLVSLTVSPPTCS
jgi:hypothetical protein